MKRIIQIALSLSCVLGLAMGQTVFAAQFNVTVPVNLSKMPATFTHVMVKGFLLCNSSLVRESMRATSGVPSWDSSIGDFIGQRKIVGASQQIRSIDTSTGEFHSSIVLNINVAPGFFPNNVIAYYYRFKLLQNGVEIEPTQLAIGANVQVSALDNAYEGNFINPAMKGSQCDEEDFSL